MANLKTQQPVTQHLCPASVRFLSGQFYSKVIILSIFHMVRTLGQRQYKCSSPEHRRRDQDRGSITQKASRAPDCVPRIILAFHPKTRVQCVSKAALCPESTLNPQFSLADILWCGFDYPPAEKSLKGTCHISWACVQTTNIKFSITTKALFFFFFPSFEGCKELVWFWKATC